MTRSELIRKLRQSDPYFGLFTMHNSDDVDHNARLKNNIEKQQKEIHNAPVCPAPPPCFVIPSHF